MHDKLRLYVIKKVFIFFLKIRKQDVIYPNVRFHSLGIWGDNSALSFSFILLAIASRETYFFYCVSVFFFIYT